MIVAEKYNYQAIYNNVVDKITQDLDDWLDAYDPIVPVSERSLALIQRIPVIVHKHISELSVAQIKGIHKMLKNKTTSTDPLDPLYTIQSDSITSIEDYTCKLIETDFTKRYIWIYT